MKELKTGQQVFRVGEGVKPFVRAGKTSNHNPKPSTPRGRRLSKRTDLK